MSFCRCRALVLVFMGDGLFWAGAVFRSTANGALAIVGSVAVVGWLMGMGVQERVVVSVIIHVCVLLCCFVAIIMPTT